MFVTLQFSTSIYSDLEPCCKKELKSPKFCTFIRCESCEHGYFWKSHAHMNMFTLHSRILQFHGCIDLAIRLSLTYVFLLTNCSHRCALYLDPAGFAKVLDAPWLRLGVLLCVVWFAGGWGVGGFQGVGGGV